MNKVLYCYIRKLWFVWCPSRRVEVFQSHKRSDCLFVAAQYELEV